jgi:hypothetical protein
MCAERTSAIRSGNSPETATSLAGSSFISGEYDMRQRCTTHKLKTSHQDGPKPRKDENVGDTKRPKTIAGDSENTSLRKEVAKTAPEQVGTSTECIPSKNLGAPRRNSVPPKIIRKDGDIYFECDAASSRQTFGTTDPDLSRELRRQLSAALPECEPGHSCDCNHALAALNSIGPENAREGMVSVQMVATNNLVMEYLAKAAWPGQPDMVVDLNLNRATKLQRMFIALLDALSRLRDKGAHKMIVEEVHVHDRGQAIVGPVSHQSSTVMTEEDDGESNR